MKDLDETSDWILGEALGYDPSTFEPKFWDKNILKATLDIGRLEYDDYRKKLSDICSSLPDDRIDEAEKMLDEIVEIAMIFSAARTNTAAINTAMRIVKGKQWTFGGVVKCGDRGR